MKSPLNTPLHLKEREVLPIENGAGLEVKCLQGSLWITQYGDHQDRVINRGESFVLDRDGLSLVTAPIGPAVLIVRRYALTRPWRRKAA